MTERSIAQRGEAMRILFSLAIVGALALIAWPAVDPPDEPALTFVATGQSNWDGRRAAWIGDDDKRNAIIMSAVWAPTGYNRR